MMSIPYTFLKYTILDICTGFLRKVYGILSAQLLTTTILASIFLLHEPAKQFVQEKYVAKLYHMVWLTGQYAD